MKKKKVNYVCMKEYYKCIKSKKKVDITRRRRRRRRRGGGGDGRGENMK